jgi:hypothetical protein
MKMKRLLLILGMVSVLTAQSATIKNSIIGYTSVGDTVSFEKPTLWSFIKDDNSKWMASLWIEAPWSDKSVYVEELFYKPYSDKFTICLGRQAIPFGSNVPYLDLTRGDKFTYATPTPNDVGLLYFGDGISIYGGVGKWFLETYYGNDIENGYDVLTTARLSYEVGDIHFIGVSVDNQDRQVLDVSGYSKYVDYVTEFREDYQWGRAIIKSGKYGLSALAGFERTEDETQALYGLVYQYGEPNQFVSAELSGEGDVRVKLYYGFNLNVGNKND